MKSKLLFVLLSSVVYGQKTLFTDLPVLNPEYHVEIGEKYLSEIGCLQSLDHILKRKWMGEMSKISIRDLGDLGTISWEVKDSSYTRYNTLEDEWLMDDMLPASRLEQCFRNLVPDVVPLMTDPEIDCLNEVFDTHVVSELDHREEFERVLKATHREQLPFRKFIGFTELVEMMFQNRNPDALSDRERILYDHAESYLITDEDRVRPSYSASQDCDWKNAKALREVSSEKARLKEFKSQVRSSVNKFLASYLVKRWNLNATLPRDRYERWLEAREDMMVRLDIEVKKLRNQRKDAQWLCEYASLLAREFSDEQLGILLTEDSSWIHLEVSDLAAKARAVEKTFRKLNDFRHGVMKKMADKYEEGTSCLFAFLHLVQNHRRYDLATAFIDEHYSYPEIYCGERSTTFGLVQMFFCNCVGSFCILHPIAAVFADEYAMTQAYDGSYQIVRTGRRSKRKVRHCHIIANGQRELQSVPLNAWWADSSS